MTESDTQRLFRRVSSHTEDIVRKIEAKSIFISGNVKGLMDELVDTLMEMFQEGADGGDWWIQTLPAGRGE